MNKSLTLLVTVAVLSAVFALSVFAAGPYIYVANAGEDTVSKIDVGSNSEVARYAMWFTSGINSYPSHASSVTGDNNASAHLGPAPSRIAQDSAGNVYVLDRFFPGSYGTSSGLFTPVKHLPVLIKIAPSGGAPGTTTSVGSTVLPITDTITGTPPNIDPGEAKDVRILWAKPIGQSGDEGNLGRAVAIDKAGVTGVLWVGLYDAPARYYRVDPGTGNILPPITGISIPTVTGKSYGAYGAQVDVNGKLWSVDEHETLTEIDTTSSSYPAIPHHHGAKLGPHDYGENYSLSVFNDCSSTPAKVTVYLSEHRLARTYIIYDAQTQTFSNPALPSNAQFNSVSIGVDSHGDIVSGEWYGTGRVIKSHPNGQVVWDTTVVGSTVPMRDLHGIIIDANDDVWAVDLYGNQVVKYKGTGANGGTHLATVAVGNAPYTYGNAPPPTCSGTATPTPTPSATPGCATVADKEIRCLPNGDYSYTFTVTNNSSISASQVLLTPVQGSTFTLVPQLTNLSSSLQSGQSMTISTTIGNGKPGDKVCFFVSLMSEKTQCCIVQVCLTLPDCGQVTPTPTATASLTPVPRHPPRGRRRP